MGLLKLSMTVDAQMHVHIPIQESEVGNVKF